MADDRARLTFVDWDNDQKTIHNLHESMGASSALFAVANDPVKMLDRHNLIMSEGEDGDE